MDRAFAESHEAARGIVEAFFYRLARIETKLE